MKRTFIALALSSSLMAGAAAAQSNVATMDVGLSMLELAVTNEMSRLGITGVDAMSLSLSQLAEIRTVFGNGDRNRSEKKKQIQTILTRD